MTQILPAPPGATRTQEVRDYDATHASAVGNYIIMLSDSGRIATEAGALGAMCTAVRDLRLYLDDTDLPPTKFAINAATDILERVSDEPEIGALPRGDVTSDGDGGIRLEWRSNYRCLIVALGPNPQAPSYIFIKTGGGDRGHVEHQIDSAQIARLLLDVTAIGQ